MSSRVRHETGSHLRRPSHTSSLKKTIDENKINQPNVNLKVKATLGSSAKSSSIDAITKPQTPGQLYSLSRIYRVSADDCRVEHQIEQDSTGFTDKCHPGPETHQHQTRQIARRLEAKWGIQDSLSTQGSDATDSWGEDTERSA